MEMTGLQIFKYMPAAKKLPQSNCKECGCPTCMVYSLKLAKLVLHKTLVSLLQNLGSLGELRGEINHPVH